MNRNLIAAGFNGMAFAFLFFAMVMLHLILTSGVIGSDMTKYFRFEFNYSSIMFSIALMKFGDIFLRPNEKYYHWVIQASVGVIAISLLHILALWTEVIYEDWYKWFTAGVIFVIMLLFFSPIKDAYNRDREKDIY